ncbi:hypothetical protein SKa4_00068 [Pseudomonas phage vB_PpuM-SKa-4]
MLPDWPAKPAFVRLKERPDTDDLIPVDFSCTLMSLPKSFTLPIVTEDGSHHVLRTGIKAYARITAFIQMSGPFKGKDVGFRAQADQARAFKLADLVQRNMIKYGK